MRNRREYYRAATLRERFPQENAPDPCALFSETPNRRLRPKRRNHWPVNTVSDQRSLAGNQVPSQDQAARTAARRADERRPASVSGTWRGPASIERITQAAAVAGYLESIRLHDVLFYDFRPPTREGLVDNIVIDHLSGLLRAGVRAGAWRIDDPRFTAVFLFSGLHGVVDDAYSKRKRVNRSRLALRLERLCLRAAGLPLG